MYAPPKNEYEVVKGTMIVTTPPEKRFVRKISGTSFAGIVGMSPWDTRFTAMCKFLGLCDEDISSKPAVVAGKVLEEVIVEHCRHLGVIPASEVFEPRTGSHDEWPSDFDDPDFVGHLDGMMADGSAVVEVKTTGRPEDWADGVPMHYWLQASLYAHFMGVDKIVFLVGILTDEDRRNPLNWDPAGHVYRVDVQKHPDTEKLIEKAREIRHSTLRSEVVPLTQYDPSSPKDKELMDYFQSRLLEGGELFDKACELAEVEDRIRQIETENKDLYDRAKSLRETLKTAMVSSERGQVTTQSGTYKLVKTTRRTLDKALIIEDGLDPDRYSKTTESYTLRRD